MLKYQLKILQHAIAQDLQVILATEGSLSHSRLCQQPETPKQVNHIRGGDNSIQFGASLVDFRVASQFHPLDLPQAEIQATGIIPFL